MKLARQDEGFAQKGLRTSPGAPASKPFFGKSAIGTSGL
jgi:hypothetical protein